MRESEMYNARATSAHDEADAATLDNVRDRCLRSEQAWAALAQRSVRIETARTTREAAADASRTLLREDEEKH